MKKKSKLSYVPIDLKDCLMVLDDMFSDTVKRSIKRIPESDLSQLHMSYGMTLRNRWGLWIQSRLARWFNSIGINHPDDMSSIILTSYKRYLNNEPIDLNKQVKKFQEYWKQHRGEKGED